MFLTSKGEKAYHTQSHMMETVKNKEGHLFFSYALGANIPASLSPWNIKIVHAHFLHFNDISRDCHLIFTEAILASILTGYFGVSFN